MYIVVRDVRYPNPFPSLLRNLDLEWVCKTLRLLFFIQSCDLSITVFGCGFCMVGFHAKIKDVVVHMPRLCVDEKT